MNSFTQWPSYTSEEAEAVSRVLLSNNVNYWTGDEGREFEREFADWISVKYAVAVANGTVALDSSLRALGVGPGDEVIVTARTFIASVSSIVNCGATPVFADVDVNSQNITAETISPLISKRTRAMICVHLAGWPCDMDPIMKLAHTHNLFVIEDCAQAHGAKYKGRSVGSIGDIAAWSFCTDKIMTTGGEGGMVTTNNHDLWAKVWSYKDHGKSWEAVYNNHHPEGFRWVHDAFGTNGRMTEMQAAIGRIQLGRMTDWHLKRAENANHILDACRKFPDVLRFPQIPEGSEHAWYKAYVFVRTEGLKAGWDRDRILSEIKTEGVPCYVGACPEVYLEKAFDKTGFRPDSRLPVARLLGETSLMFLVHPSLSADEVDLTCSAINRVISRAAK